MKPAPTIEIAAIEHLLGQSYGLAGELESLISERDQNFRLTTSDGHRYVVKVANAAEDELVADCQAQALLHLQRQHCPVPVPRVMRTRDGAAVSLLSVAGARHIVRLVTYLPGAPLTGAKIDQRLATDLGMALARLDRSLSDFEHAGDRQDMLWDMQRAAGLRDLVPSITDAGTRELVTRCLDDFEQHAAPILPSLRSQIIHNDLNPANVLLADDGSATIVGIIDFGDILRAPLIIDVAIAAAYLRPEEGDTLQLAAPFIAGFDAETPLEDIEISLLHDLIRTRLATTVTMKHWRLATSSGDDPYLRESLRRESSAVQFLVRISQISRSSFEAQIREICGR